jgi:hypothetical protein
MRIELRELGTIDAIVVVAMLRKQQFAGDMIIPCHNMV